MLNPTPDWCAEASPCHRPGEVWRLLFFLILPILLVFPSCAFVRPELPTDALEQRIYPPHLDLAAAALAPSASAPSDAPASELPHPRKLPGGREEPPQLIPEGPLTLEQVIANALHYNPSLEVLRQRVEQAGAGREIAFADFLPEVRALYRHVQGVSTNERFVLPTIPTEIGNIAFGGMSDQFQTTELQLQWTLWDFGRTTGRYGQSVAALRIAELTHQRARETVAFNVTAAYFQVLRAWAYHRIAEEAVRRAEAHLRDARNFLKRGTVVRNDVLRAEVMVAEMQLDLVRARTAEAEVVAGLNQAIGFNVNSPTRVVDLSQDSAFDLTLPECLQLAVGNRDEFQIVLQTITSSQLGVEVARADYMPRVFVAGAQTHLEGKGIKNSQLTNAGVKIELNLFDGGRRAGKLRGARAEVAAAFAQGQDICDKIAYEVDVAYLKIIDAHQRIDLTRTMVTQARENLRVVTSLFQKGDATPTEVVDAELALVRAQQNYATALYDYQTGLARLAYAIGLPVGGEFPPRLLMANPCPEVNHEQ